MGLPTHDRSATKMLDTTKQRLGRLRITLISMPDATTEDT